MTTSSKVIPEALSFLDPIDRICAERPPRLLCSAHVLVGAMFVMALSVASLVKIDVVVTAAGRLATDVAPIVMQPMERAILREINVKPGDVVSKGQILATLDPTFAHADQAALADQLRAQSAQLRRLEAEATGARSATPPVLDLPRQPNAEDVLQMAVFRERQTEYRSRLLVFDEGIEQLRANLRTTDDDREVLSRQLDVTRSVETMRETLLARQVGSKLQYFDAVSERLRAERELLQSADRLTELQHGLNSKSAERQNFIDARVRELSESLVATRGEVAKDTEALAKSLRLNDLVVIAAPQDGVVLEVAPRSAGSVLREAEPLLTITPSHATIIAEITIGSHDVGDVLPGAAVEIKVDAFPFQRHGTLKGRLLSISEESYPSASGADAFHRGRVELLETQLKDLSPSSKLFPGMTLIGEIQVGARTALSYFLTPITRGLHESMREP